MDVLLIDDCLPRLNRRSRAGVGSDFGKASDVIEFDNVMDRVLTDVVARINIIR